MEIQTVDKTVFLAPTDCLSKEVERWGGFTVFLDNMGQVVTPYGPNGSLYRIEPGSGCALGGGTVRLQACGGEIACREEHCRFHASQVRG